MVTEFSNCVYGEIIRGIDTLTWHICPTNVTTSCEATRWLAKTPGQIATLGLHLGSGSPCYGIWAGKA